MPQPTPDDTDWIAIRIFTPRKNPNNPSYRHTFCTVSNTLRYFTLPRIVLMRSLFCIHSLPRLLLNSAYAAGSIRSIFPLNMLHITVF
mgnify:CR=1 FL=1